ncbi:putative c6 finger domain-containing protein [Diaporthe ampelina]|uniref:Putative c6 finger domain-containing protein n=1 Tax=Diaporthe ampelina TaxID=1214573 RepID=A0A0G2FSP9_9PEZI|nr:putative c6 finger domain-containing protein [Diaporthe ampelina]
MSREDRVMEFTQPQYHTPAVPRSVKFELVTDSTQYRARLPMRVQIYPHDTTESIITTVKNFYGLYPSATSCPGVSFEDEHGNTIIGRYENFRHNSVVDSMNGYSSGDNAPGSSSGKSKEQIGSTEISLDNIVEGGRRKRAKFESSELPLFAPPQMPAALSNPSVSPARRIEHNRATLPFVQPGQNPFTNPRLLQSPQSYTPGYNGVGMYATPVTDTRRARSTIGYSNALGIGPNMGILPTPDPTVGSCMSEEDKDVAIQLMRLGDISNISHGRTSASTLDDTFSRNADAASSTGATSDGDSESDGEKQPLRKQKLDAAGTSKKIYPTTETHFSPANAEFEPSEDEDVYSDGGEGTMSAPKLKAPKVPNGQKSRNQSTSVKPKSAKASKSAKPPTGTKVKKSSGIIPNGPMSPTSLPASRKPSIVSNPGAASSVQGDDDHPDLSTKPRCQRCRKSKKGCDRQRPCGRCRDAGIPAELCISEDEGNGRKGRYGRHMGVPVVGAKEEMPAPANPLLPAAPIATAMVTMTAVTSADKNKKRKR